VLGEGRMIYSLAVLDENPFERVVGWKDDLILYDPDAYRKYQAVFPEAADIPNLGSPYAADCQSAFKIAPPSARKFAPLSG
jgi:iron complex transport system substrate-binding protein